MNDNNIAANNEHASANKTCFQFESEDNCNILYVWFAVDVEMIKLIFDSVTTNCMLFCHSAYIHAFNCFHSVTGLFHFCVSEIHLECDIRKISCCGKIVSFSVIHFSPFTNSFNLMSNKRIKWEKVRLDLWKLVKMRSWN